MPVDPKKLPKGRTAADATVDYVGAVLETVARGFNRVNESLDKVAQQQEKTELALAQLTGQVRELAKQQQRTADNLDRHLALAEQQTINIAELTKLCTVLASKVS
ncbi:MAG: hypothetical protein AAFR31_09980 [Cyanobacteria bacterium J06627_8]